MPRPQPPYHSGAISRDLRRLGAAGLMISLLSGAALAAPPTLQLPTDETLQEGTASNGLTGFLTGISRSSYLLGDMWGLRSQLARSGITFALQETSEVLGNVTGGSTAGLH